MGLLMSFEDSELLAGPATSQPCPGASFLPGAFLPAVLMPSPHLSCHLGPAVTQVSTHGLLLTVVTTACWGVVGMTTG